MTISVQVTRGDGDRPAAEGRLRLPYRLVALGDAFGALEAHGGVAHAVRADGTVAALAAHVGFASGVPVAGGNGRGFGLAGWLGGHDVWLALRGWCYPQTASLFMIPRHPRTRTAASRGRPPGE